ncbi:hypothetical protein LSH36_1280g00098 [Paralvinella palmiformis]|uniref:MPN domain-containing protein n=1 Tax=Paralvinella palmiformis TaxID=53620 RepID=A0AAD9MQS7_9ANNE|nr:hypothetical protein LSH36_1280g00098 [Paralvinella palmiformis]
MTAVSTEAPTHDTGADTQEESHEDEDDEDEDDEVDEEDEDGNKSVDSVSIHKARHALTGRGVTLSMLMADGIIQPGPSSMSIDYLGQKFTADLLEDGSIRWKEADKLFSSPSAWAIHCKKIVNPMKKSGCGWASVRYKGKKLDSYKSSWLRKKRPLATVGANGLLTEEEDEEGETKSGNDSKRMKCDDESLEDDSVSADGAMASPIVHPKQEIKKRFSVKHSTLGRKSQMHDPNTLVECTPFAALGKIQPFSLSISTNCMLLMDFHCHLTTSEVVGYLGGKWDPGTQHLSVEQAFPCKCRLGDKETAPGIESKIKERMHSDGLTLAGWYHSHPNYSANPSLRDLEAQIEYQLQMKGPGESIQPCVSLIISPYNQHSNLHEESELKAVWVMAPPEHRPLDYGMPMRMCYDITEDQDLTGDVLSEMKELVKFHQGEVDFVDFHTSYHNGASYLDKLKASLSRKLPKDQEADKQLLDFLNTTLI